jgi:aspartate kinase
MEVFKFGGASVKDVTSFRNVTNIIGDKKSLIVVISAMGKTTNKLETLLDEFIAQKDWKTTLTTIQKEHDNLVEGLFIPPEKEVIETLNKIFGYLKLYLENATQTNYDEIYDQVVPVGELLSSKILHFLLRKEGIENDWIDIRKVLKTNNMFRKAELDWVCKCKSDTCCHQ